MDISIQNLGAIKQADISLGDFTIICGKNNTGKTYITYAIYGFLDYWHNARAIIDIPNKIINELIDNGSVSVPLELFAKESNKILNKTSKEYSAVIDKIFAGKESLFADSKLSITVAKDNTYKTNNIQITVGSAGGRNLLGINKEENEENITISLMIDKKSEDIPPRIFIEDMISSAIQELIFKNQIPKAFISSAERTGSAIFQKELDFTRNRLVDLLGDKSSKISPARLLGKFSAEYPVPVKKNIDFIRDLPNITNKESIFLKEHPDILNKFHDIIGGEYKVSKDGEIQYIPNKKRAVKLSLVESSSAVRSLLDLGFYLRHIAQPGDLLVIDEPELNLHPENQRKVARLLSMLVNHGIKVFITTHSDYIIKELNTLILLNKRGKRLEALAKREGYEPLELLNCNKLKVYMANEALVKVEGNSKRTKCHTLIPAKITQENGIELESFDNTIEDMNRIQEEIIWGE